MSRKPSGYLGGIVPEETSAVLVSVNRRAGGHTLYLIEELN